MKEYHKKDVSDDQAIAMLMRPGDSINLAAMYLKYVKETIKIPNPRGMTQRDITWAEAAVAYCGCSGVALDRKTGEIAWRNFVAWRMGGELKAGDAAEGKRRYAAMTGWVPRAAALSSIKGISLDASSSCAI